MNPKSSIKLELFVYCPTYMRYSIMTISRLFSLVVLSAVAFIGCAPAEAPKPAPKPAPTAEKKEETKAEDKKEEAAPEAKKEEAAK
jgi:hypothetical protein